MLRLQLRSIHDCCKRVDPIGRCSARWREFAGATDAEQWTELLVRLSIAMFWLACLGMTVNAASCRLADAFDGWVGGDVGADSQFDSRMRHWRASSRGSCRYRFSRRGAIIRVESP
jgi:hypothetical protein